MSEVRALAWLQWRLIRRDLAVLAVMNVGLVVLTRLLVSADEPAVVSATTAACLITGSALLLGATITAGDRGLALVRSRPVRPAAWLSVALIARLTAVAALAALSLATLLALEGREALATASPAGEHGRGLQICVLAAGSVALAFGVGVLCSALVKRPLAAVIAGAALGLGVVVVLIERGTTLPAACVVVAVLAWTTLWAAVVATLRVQSASRRWRSTALLLTWSDRPRRGMK